MEVSSIKSPIACCMFLKGLAHWVGSLKIHSFVITKERDDFLLNRIGLNMFLVPVFT